MIRGFSKVALLVFALSSGAALAAAPTFVFTAIPDQDETRLVERLSRCAQYLERRLGTRVKYAPVKTSADVQRDFCHRLRIDTLPTRLSANRRLATAPAR